LIHLYCANINRKNFQMRITMIYNNNIKNKNKIKIKIWKYNDNITLKKIYIIYVHKLSLIKILFVQSFPHILKTTPTWSRPMRNILYTSTSVHRLLNLLYAMYPKPWTLLCNHWRWHELRVETCLEFKNKNYYRTLLLHRPFGFIYGVKIHRLIFFKGLVYSYRPYWRRR